MKRVCCALLALCLFSGFALAEGDEFGNDWEFVESRFGYSLWYDADQLVFWTEDWNGAPAECFCPYDDHSGVAMLACVGSRFSMTQWDKYTRVDPDETDVCLEYPYEVTAFIDADGYAVTEQWIVSAADADYVFILQYEPDDPEGWAPLFHSVLETLEFPSQPAENADFRLDFFQGGAAGMQFTDLIVDEDAEPIVLISLREMTDFALEYLDWDFCTMEPTVLMTLYAATNLAPGNNLRVSCYFEDVMPNLRVRYTDTEGEAQCFYLFQSGRDGSLLLLAESEL